MARLSHFYNLSALLGFFIAGPLYAKSSVRELLAQDRLEEALPICRQFEVLSSANLDNDLACGWVYLRLQKYDSAERILFKLQRRALLPEYQLLQALSQMKKKQFDSAASIIDSVKAQNRGTPVGLTAEELAAELYELKGQLESAAFIYRGLVGTDPRRARAHWGLGRFYLGRGDFGKAKLHLTETTRLWPKHVASRYNLAVLALSEDNLREASIWLSDAYRLNRADPGVLEQLGILFERRKFIPEAVRYWERALEVNRESSIAKEKLAQYFYAVIDTMVESKQYAQALARIENSGREVSRDPKLLLRRGLIYKNLGIERSDLTRIEKAAADLTVYLNQVPGDALAIRELGICYVNLRRLDAAARQFDKAIREEPGNGMNYAWYGFVLEARGELKKARSMYLKALEYLKDPAEVEKANRKLASIEKKIGE